jgi:hypothetical protein
MKFAPLTVSVNELLPTGADDGLMEEIAGVGLLFGVGVGVEVELPPPPQPLSIKAIPAIHASPKTRLNLIID